MVGCTPLFRGASRLADASRADRDTVALTTLAGVADSYFKVLSLRDRLGLAALNLNAAQKLLDVIQARFNAGVANPVELAAQKAALAAAGIEAWVVADAALPFLLSQAHALWIGADAVTDTGVLNKIGSYTCALAAREHGVPAWAIAVRRKLLPVATPALGIAEMPPAEIWEDPPAGVRPRNVYFEMVPMALLRGVVLETEVLGATEVAVAAKDRALPSELAAATAR